MSQIAEMVELDAAIAEAELDDEQAQRARAAVADGVSIADAIAQEAAEVPAPSPPGPDAPPPPPPPAEPTEDDFKRLDKENQRHLKAVGGIMGDAVEGFEVCRECSGVGIVPPGPRPRSNENFKACETCAGFGEVLTGSLRPGQESRDCPECRGRGYLEALGADGSPLAPQTGAVAAGAVPIEQPPPPAGNISGNVTEQAPRFGVPAWMGDPNLGG